jgi:hypothetical protein
VNRVFHMTIEGHATTHVRVWKHKAGKWARAVNAPHYQGNLGDKQSTFGC